MVGSGGGSLVNETGTFIKDSRELGSSFQHMETEPGMCMAWEAAFAMIHCSLGVQELYEITVYCFQATWSVEMSCG